MKIQFNLNNKKIDADVNIGQTLFEYLRENGVYSVKYGCETANAALAPY